MMITRIVKLTFRAEEIAKFKHIFAENQSYINAFPGCQSVQLKRDAARPDVFFTLSKWNTLEDLEKYRQSELFQIVWARTKALFAEKAEAWSMVQAETEL